MTISSTSQQQPPRLRRQLVERTAQHFMREPVGDRMSSSVTSMYSTALPLVLDGFLGR